MYMILHLVACEFWSFHGGDVSSPGLLGCGAVQCCDTIQTFQRTI